MNSLKQKYKKNENIVLREIAENNILLFIGRKSSDQNSIFTLNATAVMLWKMIEKNFSVEDMINSFIKEFQVEYQIAHDDIINLLNELKNINGIIQIKGD